MIIADLGQAKVHELEVVVEIKHQVLWAEVQMSNVQTVNMHKGLQ